MSTKNQPGNYNCYANAEPDEPLFTLLARDVHAPFLLRAWADVREASGEAPVKVEEARSCADAMERWNTKHRGRKPLSAQAVFDLLSRGEMMATLDPLAGLGELGGDLSGLDDDDVQPKSPTVTQTPAQPTEKRGPAVSNASAPATGSTPTAPGAKAATKPVAGEQRAIATEIRLMCEKLRPHADWAGEVISRIELKIAEVEAPLKTQIAELETKLATLRCGLPVTSGSPDDGNAETGWLCALPKGHDGSCDTDGT